VKAYASYTVNNRLTGMRGTLKIVAPSLSDLELEVKAYRESVRDLGVKLRCDLKDVGVWSLEHLVTGHNPNVDGELLDYRKEQDVAILVEQGDGSLVEYQTEGSVDAPDEQALTPVEELAVQLADMVVSVALLRNNLKDQLDAQLDVEQVALTAYVNDRENTSAKQALAQAATEARLLRQMLQDLRYIGY
jgi:hypothetical protein